MTPLDALPRLPDWEPRLNAVLEAAYGRPYMLGEHDCFRLACAVVQALVGVDRWPRFAGTYRTRRQCLLALAAWGPSFSEAASAFFGSNPVSWKAARRGDIAEWRDANGEAHLVIVRGADCFALIELREGSLQGTPLPGAAQAIPLHTCRSVWRVGNA